jgi:hypothetical protein
VVKQRGCSVSGDEHGRAAAHDERFRLIHLNAVAIDERYRERLEWRLALKGP